MGFIGVYKAIYDYQPQSEGELPISEGDILYVLDKSGEDDWWKAKKKASEEDDEEPVGLIPNNYIEEAHPISHARALYDYTRQTDEELSFTEEAQLQVLDTSDPDWILVGLDGEFGFAPANYIELEDEVAAPQSLSPSLPSRSTEPPKNDKSSNTGNPAAALMGISHHPKASAPALQRSPDICDGNETPLPSQPEKLQTPDLTQNQPSPLGGPRMSPPYNRASNPRGIDDEVASHLPGGFHMYNINEMVSVMGKQKKMPTTLGINNATGVILIAPEKLRDGPEQRWTADKMTHYSIEGKHVFIELVRPSKSVDFHAGAKDTAQEIVSALGELAGAIRAEGLREVIMAGSGQSQKRGEILYDFTAQGDDELTVAAGDDVIVIDDSKNDEWWKVRRLKTDKEGVIPSSYVKIKGTTETTRISDVHPPRSTVEQNRLEEERLAKDSIRSAGDSRGTEVGPGVRLPERGSSLSTRRSSNSHDIQRHENDRNDYGQLKGLKSKPDLKKVRTWNDRSKSFSVEAQFLALKDGKINLHKLNGVKIAVPVAKMSIEDLEYVERQTGISLDDEKPLSGLRKARSQETESPREPNFGAGATIERQSAKPEYDWFQFFLSCDVPVHLCERYLQAFQRDSMDESVLPDIDATVLRTLGIREGDIIKIMRFLDKKFSRTSIKRGVSFGGEEVIGPDSEPQGGLFSGPGGTLKNNTRKVRPSATTAANNAVDLDSFSQATKGLLASKDTTTSLPSMSIQPKDDSKNGFDDDAWDLKPSKPQTSSVPSSASVSQPQQIPKVPKLTGAMGDLSLLSAPLEPIKVQPKSLPQVTQTAQPVSQILQAPQLVTPSFFTGIGSPQSRLTQAQVTPTNVQYSNQMTAGLDLARLQPLSPQLFPGQSQGSIMGSTPNRPLSAPNVNPQSPFALPPLQPQATGIQTSTGYQLPNFSHGLASNDLRTQQMYNGFNGPQNAQNLAGVANLQSYNQLPNKMLNEMPNTFQQFPMQNSMTQQNVKLNVASPFSDPQPQQFLPMAAQPTGFQSSFPQLQFPHRTAVNSFLSAPLQPALTGVQQPTEFNLNVHSPAGSIISRPNTMMPLVPQKTGPPPPVRFGVSGDAKSFVLPNPGRRANLSQATPQNPFGF